MSPIRAVDRAVAADLTAIGRRVLRLEADALVQLADALGEGFAEAVLTLLNTRGRVIVSGMGKSGHVARKIAATFASTGTPAQFVHPAEASHGDLGMLTRADAALVLSNSGETAELHDIVAHTRRFQIPLIGVASRPHSALLQAADVAIVLPQAPEACPVGLAPTTSTTMALALGDALAVALMERRAFSVEQFRTFHPGGKLGAMLVKVRDLMHPRDRAAFVPLDAPMRDVILAMTARGFGVAGVLDAEGRLVGAISDGDLRRNWERLDSATAADVATFSPRCIGPDALASAALAAMNGDPRTTVLFVAEPEPTPPVPLGLIHVHDCLRAGVA